MIIQVYRWEGRWKT